MSTSRIVACASAYPEHHYSQDEVLSYARDYTLGPNWQANPQATEHARQMERLFRASKVEQRQSVVDLPGYYAKSRSTGERMAQYQTAAYPLARASLEAALNATESVAPSNITDFVVVSCTGYSAPGLDIQLARDLGMPRDVRRVVVGHMGCFGALVGLRQCFAALRAHPGAVVALLSVELTTLHFAPTLDMEVLTSFSLFGDAAATLLLTADEGARGPELVDVYCAADFATADQMSWTITDQGFIMSLSPRVPVSLRRNIAGVVERLLTPHGLKAVDVTHWLVHPGGPSILDAVRGKLELSDEQIALSWKVLREHGNCSSATVLLMLDELLRSGQAKPGEWGVMMAFGPGLTLETCLLRF